MTDKRLTPAATENQRHVLEYVLHNPGCAILPAAETVRATPTSPHGAGYDVVWRCVRRGWLKADRANKTARGGRYSLTITAQGVRELQPSTQTIASVLRHALRYSDHADDAHDVALSVGYDALSLVADVESTTQARAVLRERLADGTHDDTASVWLAIADAIDEIAGRA